MLTNDRRDIQNPGSGFVPSCRGDASGAACAWHLESLPVSRELLSNLTGEDSVQMSVSSAAGLASVRALFIVRVGVAPMYGWQVQLSPVSLIYPLMHCEMAEVVGSESIGVPVYRPSSLRFSLGSGNLRPPGGSGWLTVSGVSVGCVRCLYR